jgi:hypothetical protein
MKKSIDATPLFLTIDFGCASKKSITEQEMFAQYPVASNETVEILIMN